MSKHQRSTDQDTALLRQFVESWSRVGVLWDDEVPAELAAAPDEYGGTYWRPIAAVTNRSALENLYAGLGLPGLGATRLPPLYEQLVLSYRWAAVDLKLCSLLPNMPALDLGPLLDSMLQHRNLRETLQPNGYFLFGQGLDRTYDPVCFDLRHRQRNGDCRVVQLDHEAILCNHAVQETSELASSFRDLILQTIRDAQDTQ